MKVYSQMELMNGFLISFFDKLFDLTFNFAQFFRLSIFNFISIDRACNRAGLETFYEVNKKILRSNAFFHPLGNFGYFLKLFSVFSSFHYVVFICFSLAMSAVLDVKFMIRNECKKSFKIMLQ